VAERYQALEGERSRPARTLREDHWRDLTSGLHPYALEESDRVAAAFFVEPRYPFYDRRLVEFCLALPPEQRLSQGWTRVIVRRALAGTLPNKIQWRAGKANWRANFQRGLLSEREVLEEVLSDDSQVIEEYVDLAALRLAYQRFVSRATLEDALLLWTAVVLSRWLDQTGIRA
jgi:asparagine synthase (glutamine-hydrolysing)